jgi:hypothetical protein
MKILGIILWIIAAGLGANSLLKFENESARRRLVTYLIVIALFLAGGALLKILGLNDMGMYGLVLAP